MEKDTKEKFIKLYRDLSFIKDKDSKEYDILADEMDDLWYKLTKNEHDEIRFIINFILNEDIE